MCKRGTLFPSKKRVRKMRTPKSKGFDSNWRDDVFDSQSLELPLAFPAATPRNDGIWIETQLVHQETIFGCQYTYSPPRLKTAVLKASDVSQRFTVVDQDGQEMSPGSSITAVLFPPKAWMSDSGEERCMMFAAANHAKGHVLVGGLGLGIYPQMALALNSSIQSITIVERDPQIIRLVSEGWLQRKPEHQKVVTILQGTIEDYLSSTQQVFDTIYLDTWEDADPRLLANVNHLIALASGCCSPIGTIQCWGYACMVDSFVETATMLTQQKFPWNKYRLDPALQVYAAWLETQEGDVLESTIQERARAYALNIQHPFDPATRHQYFSACSTSFIDASLNTRLTLRST